MDGWTDKWMNGQMHGGWMDGWEGGWTDGWMGGGAGVAQGQELCQWGLSPGAWCIRSPAGRARRTARGSNSSW